MSDVLVDDAGGDSFHFDNHARELCVSRCKSYYCGGYGFFIGQGCTGFQLGGHQRRLRRQCQRAVNSAIIGTTGGNNAGLPLGSQLYGLQTAGTCTNTSIIGNQVSGSPASLVLAACTSDGTTGQAAPKLAPTAHTTAPAQAVPVNPPPILKMTGATPDPGTTFGQYDIYSGRYVSGTFPHGETATVTADPGPDAYAADLARNGSGDDYHRVVVIPAKNVTITLTASAGDSGPD